MLPFPSICFSSPLSRVLRGVVAAEEEEAQIMADVPGWEVGKSVYHTDKWILPHPSQLKEQ